MSSLKNTAFLYCVIVFLVIILLYLLFKPTAVDIVERHDYDTVVVRKTDTIFRDKPKYIKEKIVDTVHVYIRDTVVRIVPLPITQRHYHERGLYDVWVSGYRPILDSINVFKQIEYKTITHTITREIYPKRWDAYIGVGFQAYSNRFAPKLAIGVSTPWRFMFAANIGYYDKKVIYGVDIYYRFFKK